MEQLYFKLTSPDSEAGLTDDEFEEFKRLTTECNLNERKVLKVGSSQPAMPEPQMQQDMGGMNDMEPMGEEPMQGDENFDDMSDASEGGSEFDTNFDAGVEADEDEDPKKYIQQLTGKLSQELGKYNNELGEPDEELSKYVGGMIVKQVSKFLNDEDKKELIKKIKTTDSVDDEDEDMLDEPEMDDNSDESNDLELESYILDKKGLNKIFESLGLNGEILGIEKNNSNVNLKKEKNKVNKTNKPFSSPKFK